MDLTPALGNTADLAWASASARMLLSVNMRLRAVPPAGISLETIGLTSALQTLAGGELILPNDVTKPYRTIFPFQVAGSGINWLCGSSSHLERIIADPSSTTQTGTRYQSSDLTPPGLSIEDDDVPSPSLGETFIPPAWAFADDGDYIVGVRTDIDEPVHSWKRPGVTYAQLNNAPGGAVGIAITGRILVLLGAESFVPGTVQRWNCVRWSDRLNYNAWVPSALSVSGENYVENGSRIVGGGSCGRYGIGVWTDQNFTLLNSTGDIDAIFAFNEVDDKRGLYANKAWTNHGGAVYWVDQNKDLVVYDGSQPRVIPNPLKTTLFESVSVDQAPRVYMASSEDFQEVQIWIPASDTDLSPTRCLVYQPLLDVWYSWALVRPSWSPRLGVNPALGIDLTGRVLSHDLDIGLPAGVTPLLTGSLPGGLSIPGASNVEPFSWTWASGLLTPPDSSSQTHGMTRIMLTGLHTSAIGAETDIFSVAVRGFDGLQIISDSFEESQDWGQNEAFKDYRVTGRSLQLVASGTGVKTVFRFGMLDAKVVPEGER